MQQAYRIVSEQLRVTFEQAKRRYDQRVKSVRFKLHEFVWFYCPRIRPGRGRKFRQLTSGPFRIVRILNDVNYAIQKIPNGRIQICHVDRLLKYEGETPAIWVKYDREVGVNPTDGVNTFSQASKQQNPVTRGGKGSTKLTPPVERHSQEPIRIKAEKTNVKPRTSTKFNQGRETPLNSDGSNVNRGKINQQQKWGNHNNVRNRGGNELNHDFRSSRAKGNKRLSNDRNCTRAGNIDNRRTYYGKTHFEKRQPKYQLNLSTDRESFGSDMLWEEHSRLNEGFLDIQGSY